MNISFKKKIGTDASTEEIAEKLYVRLEDLYTELGQLAKESSATTHTQVPKSLSAEQCLPALQTEMKELFPSPGWSSSVIIKEIPASLSNYTAPAYYFTPSITACRKGNTESVENIIYVGSEAQNDPVSLFTTLAHEGYPGHLYQTTYFHSLSPAPIRCLLGCDGYVEGWATYCEMMSYYFAPVSKAEATFLQKNASVMLGLYALADMGIHYKGWTLSDTIDFFSDYGIYDAGAVSEIYDLILGDPANYLKYYVGYLEFLELKKEAIGAWGEEFSQERFHREVLEAGPMPFWRLREAIM